VGLWRRADIRENDWYSMDDGKLYVDINRVPKKIARESWGVRLNYDGAELTHSSGNDSEFYYYKNGDYRLLLSE
jgi:hypothetical protein